MLTNIRTEANKSPERERERERESIRTRSWIYFGLRNVFGHLKGTFSPKFLLCHHLLIVHLFQTCMSFFLLLNTKYNILKNVGNQTVDGNL